ncbi:MAG TPA: amidohydrolase family protein [Gemmatimonas sp.]|nr:amidohydrolase family protein [Gemmatimonas sp.]
MSAGFSRSVALIAIVAAAASAGIGVKQRAAIAQSSSTQEQLAPAPPAPTLAIEHVTVIPMDRDAALVDHTVLVSGDRIVWVGPAASARVARGIRVVDGRGAFLIPGLADMHVHIDSAANLAQLVKAGVTTVRNMRGTPLHVAWRDSIASGRLVGPTIFTSGPSIRRSRDPAFVLPSTPAEAEALVRAQARAGYDMIKVLNDLTVPVYQRLLATARTVGIPVVGHVVPDVGLARTLSAGQVSLEHAFNLRERSRFQSLFGGDASQADAADATMVARAGAWVGTIVQSRDGTCAPRLAEQRAIVASLRRANVKLLAGTDAGIAPIGHGASLHCELRTLVAAGLTPYEALATATSNAGAFAKAHLRRASVPFGTVTVGSRADLVLLSTDPRRDIAALARMRGVVLRGEWRPL